jgi:hypothetical protein
MRAFVYRSCYVKGSFWHRYSGTPDEVQRLEAGQAILLSTPEQRSSSEDAVLRLGDLAVGISPKP